MHLFGYHDSFHHYSNSYSNVHEHVRIVVMGAEAVGKTSLIKQCLFHSFPTSYIKTIDDIFFYKGDKFDLDIIDTSGSHNFPEMTKIAILEGDVFVLVFSVDDWSTFDRVEALRKQITDIKGADIPIVVVGNKADVKEREITEEVADSIVCIDWGCKYYDLTAKDNEQACEVFNDILKNFPSLYGEKIAHQVERVPLPTRLRRTKSQRIRSSFLSLIKTIKDKL